MGLGSATRDGSASFCLIVVLTGGGGSFKLSANRRVKKTVPPGLGIALSFPACAPGLIRIKPLVGATLPKMLSWACAERRVAAVTASIKSPQRLPQTSRVIRLSRFLGFVPKTAPEHIQNPAEAKLLYIARGEFDLSVRGAAGRTPHGLSGHRAAVLDLLLASKNTAEIN